MTSQSTCAVLKWMKSYLGIKGNIAIYFITKIEQTMSIFAANA